MNAYSHQPVLLDAVIDGLAIKPNGRYVDGTFGRGGHSRAILDRLDKDGRLLALDRDPAAAQWAQTQFADDERFQFSGRPFSMLEQTITEQGWQQSVDGILLDLGVSSPQLDDAERGFSFRKDGPLDMRMDTSQGESAAQWLAVVEEHELVRVLRVYGEERFAKRIARAVMRIRDEQPIETTGQLSKLIAEAVPTREKKKDPATRSFQAIRIAVNHELDELESVLPQCVRSLATGGRMTVISFHSLEDRMVKRFIADLEKPSDLPPDLPITEDMLPKPIMRRIGKVIKADAEECDRNPRARSAVLRVAERTEQAYA
ncbi:MAG: 16S rRNA (cytosine(1402)-N(4))-methyltransferase RsmH [Proteobacteria bacterium]|nr:16S rRNA (cytosine(1402)-N(4))-methyltransferase RsmH [Pseudomonadota bacterium]